MKEGITTIERNGVTVELEFDEDGFPIVKVDTGSGYMDENSRPTVEVELNNSTVHEMFSITKDELQEENTNLKKVLQSCYNDCGMALDESWDMSHEGFEATMDNIEKVFPEVQPYVSDNEEN